MSEPKKGDTVLVEMVVWSAAHNGVPGLLRCEYHANTIIIDLAADDIHPHPGVSVADLVEECERAATLIDIYRMQHVGGEYMTTHYNELRAAREAANEPKLEEGQEVWVRGTLLHKCASGVFSVHVKDPHHDDSFVTSIHPDDIRTEKP